MSLRMEILVNEELLKDKLTPYREVCPLLLDVFIWRKEVYPYILGGTITFLFGLLWYVDPPVITAIALFGLFCTAADYVLPFLSKSVGVSEEWSSEKEKKFSIFVNRIAYYSVQVWNFQVTLDEWKREKPNMYSAVAVISLMFMAWIGSAVNNLFLCYLFVLFLVLLPGLLHRRILQMYFAKAVLTVTGFLGIKSKTKSN